MSADIHKSSMLCTAKASCLTLCPDDSMGMILQWELALQ